VESCLRVIDRETSIWEVILQLVLKEMECEVDWNGLGYAQWVAFVLNPTVFVQGAGVLKFHAVGGADDYFFFYRTA